MSDRTAATDPDARIRAGPLRVGIDVRCLQEGELRGFARYTLELVSALARRPALDLVGLSDGAVAFALPVPTVRFAGGREVLREQVALPLTARRERLDVLLAPANRGLPWAAPCATALTLHDAVEWDADLVAPPRGRSRTRFAYSSVVSLAAADVIITVSRASAERIGERLRIAPGRLRVVHEAAPDRFARAPDPGAVEDLCARLGIQPGYVLYLGGFERKKDVPTLLRAVAHLVRTGTAVTLVLAGAASAPRSELERLAADLQIERSVRWVGFVPDGDLPALYRGARCFAFPATAEGFGLPVVEAMACGTPVVAAGAAALVEVVAGGGVLFDPGDDAALAAALQAVCTDAGRGRDLSDRARRRAAAFSWDLTAEATEGVLREVAAVPARLRWFRRAAELSRWRHRMPPRAGDEPIDREVPHGTGRPPAA